MNINKAELIKLRNLASLSFRRKHVIVLNPEGNYEKQDDLNENIIYDETEWEIDNDEIRTFVEELSQNGQLSDEDKILAIYKKICQKYVYDDNLISYIQKYDDDTYGVPDGYGRSISQEWKNNREKHNRRVCYELARCLAKCLIEIFENDENFKICIFWDKSQTHYFVGLASNDYSLTLDVDDFNNIKDLTRIKAGLTAKGIVVLKDNKGKFQKALDKFNDGRSEDSVSKTEDEVFCNAITSDSIKEEPEDITFLKNAIEILKEKYNIDSQGLFEYIKEIVDIKLGPESRKKVWKKLKTNGNNSTRCVRCLVLNIENQQYIIDVDEMILRKFEEEELRRDDSDFMAYKELAPRNWKIDEYRGD